MFCKIVRYSFLLFNFVLTSPIAQAHNGEPHVSEPKPDTHQQSTELRLLKTGEVFEIVVVLTPKKTPNTVIYLSDPDSNRPIGEAEIKLSISSSSIKADKGDKKGVYQVNIPLNNLASFSVEIQKETFKEIFTFDNISLPFSSSSLRNWGLKIAIVFLILCILGFIGRKRIISKFKIFLSIGTLLLINLSPAFSHSDAPDVSDEKKEPAPGGNSHSEDTDHHVVAVSPQGLLIPKELQFHLGIVTEKAAQKPLKGTIRLMGTIISDPSGYARLQTTQTSRVINHPYYPLPLPGQAVKAGQIVLAVAPTLTTIESTDQKNALYKVESEITQRYLEVQRYKKLGQFAARKDLENSQAELERALKQKDEITNQTFKPELLRSPIDGFVSDLHVRPGEIVTFDKTIAEIVDPTKFLVEALVFSPEIANQIIGGYIFSPLRPDKTTEVKILGVSPKVNRADQSIHIQLKPEKIDTDIKLDMAVEVVGELKETQPSLVIPQKAVVEDSQGAWVFIHVNPETFEPRKIRLKRQLNDMVEVEEGLVPGERIVIEGAYLLNQAK